MNSASFDGWVPYIYIVEHIPSGYKYIGCQYARGCSPDNLLKTYFTSSKEVNRLIDRDGLKCFNKRIIKTFDVKQIISKHVLIEDKINVIIRPCDKECFYAIKKYVLSQESKILRRLKVKHRFNFFNKTDGTEGYLFFSAIRRIRNAKQI